MSAPQEIIIAPYEIYLAPVGEAFPAIDATPGGNWQKLGTSGKRNMSDEGVTVESSQSIQKKRNLGSTGGIKAVRTEEDLKISFSLEDMTLEQYQKALNGNAIGEIAQASGVAGQKYMTMHQGPNVKMYALLARGVSAYMDGGKAQYEVPYCYQSANVAPKFNKSDVATLKMEFEALEDPDAATDEERFGRLRQQTAAAL